MPLTALAVSVPPSVAPPGLLASDSVTPPVNVGSMLPHTSSAATSTENAAPAVTVPGGSPVTASPAAGMAVTSKASVVIEAMPSLLTERA